MNKTVILLLVVIIWLSYISLVVLHHDYKIKIQDKHTSIQLGMKENDASLAFGSKPGVRILLSNKQNNKDQRIPDIMKHLKSGTLVRYSNILPSCYLWVHFNEERYVDMIYFID